MTDSGWNGITFDDPSTGHPMLPRVTQVMQHIYSTIHPERPTPSTVDRWYSLSLSHKVDDSGRGPSIVILNLREGVRNTHFMINLNTMYVQDKFHHHRFPAPQEILSVLRELRDYVRGTIRANWEAEEARKRELDRLRELAREEQRNRVQAFYRCLVDKGLMDEDGVKDLSSDSLLCPVCSAKQTSCNMCKVISCSNIDCEVPSAIPIARCINHHNIGLCTSCLERSGSPPRLGKCPTCAIWFCSKELQWCIGRPVSSGTGPRTRLHPARPLSCWTNGCVENSQETGKSGRRCSNYACWSQDGGTRTCPDCITQDSFSCPCGQYWSCGGCKSQVSTNRGILTCPGCHGRFCRSCSYIGACDRCDQEGLCNDCMEDKEHEGVEHTISRCRSCGGFLCKKCGGKDENSCCKCDRSLCKICEIEEDDSTLDVVCAGCRESSESESEHNCYDYDDQDMIFLDQAYHDQAYHDLVCQDQDYNDQDYEDMLDDNWW